MTESNCGQHPLYSLELEAWWEAEYFKWLESERAGHDRGHPARQEWFRKYWDIFCRWRLIDHLYGRKRFKEFHDRAFGCLLNPEFANTLEVKFVLKHFLEDRWENIHFLALTWNRNLPREPLFQTLDLFRINDGRHQQPCWYQVGKI